MAPSIPTYRPRFTAPRAAMAALIVALLGSVVLVLHAPAEPLRGAAAICAFAIKAR